MCPTPPPFKWIRIAELDRDGNPVIEEGEAAAQHEGIWYIIDTGIEIQGH